MRENIQQQRFSWQKCLVGATHYSRKAKLFQDDRKTTVTNNHNQQQETNRPNLEADRTQQ